MSGSARERFGELPLTAAAEAAAADPALSPPALASGVAVTVATQGPRCGSLRRASAAGIGGNWSMGVQVDAATGAAQHTLRCPQCTLSDLAAFVLEFDPLCPAFVVTAAAVGVAGGVSASTLAFYGEPPLVLQAAEASFPATLEVLQDAVYAKPRPADGLVVGGRSAAGYSLESAGLVGATRANSSAGSVTITVKLPLKMLYSRFDFLPLMSVLSLFSAMAAWLSLISSGLYVLKVINGV